MELGGCCLTRYGSIAPVLPSKADRIMSRYRPIAPKPMALSFPPPPDADRSASSAVSVDARPALDASRSSGSRRTRKRKMDFVASPNRGSKRAAVSVKSDGNRERSSVSNSGCAAERKVIGVMRSQADAFSAGGVVCARGGLGSCASMETTESSEASVLGDVPAVAAGAISSGLMESTRMMEQDAGFMERAAASAPASVLPERRLKSSRSGGFTEMIRGITRLPSAADVHSLMQQPRSCAEGMPSCSSSSTGLAGEGLSITAAPPSFCEQIHGESRTFEQRQEGRSAELVTLRLLPEAPSRADCLSSDSCVSICDLRDQPSQERKGIFGSSSSRTNTLSLFGDEICPSTNFLRESVCDLSVIEQIYGNSSEPVLLAGEAQNVLWLNRAYERAFKDAIERQAGTDFLVVPFIDPLGIPTRMGRFNVQLQGRGCLWATLWGFLKKFVVDAGADGSYSPSRWGFPVKKSDSFNHTDARPPTRGVCDKRHCRDLGNADCASGKKCGVIVPQPIRLVGSTVSLESITDIQREASRVSESLELVKKQLEDGSSPAFITDSSNLVRWVNMAYKQMVGQPECPWLASTVNDSKGASSPTSPLPTPLLTGEVLLVSNVDVPQWASAFSGRANIQWTNTGERSYMTVPCDVSRLDECCSGKAMLVWKFDIEASLRLTCGV